MGANECAFVLQQRHSSLKPDQAGHGAGKIRLDDGLHGPFAALPPMNPLHWTVRSLANGFGLAWWARVESHSPDAVYWFGPFVRRRSLDVALPAFLCDLQVEGPGLLQYRVLRTCRREPLTIYSEGPPPDLGLR